MATASPLLFLESIETQIDDLLTRICTQIQLDDSRYKLAENHYQAVGAWLESQTAVARLKPIIYPQGSMRLNTTVKPLIGDEYDLDFVCQFMCSATFFARPVDALNLVERTLRANEIYKPMVERKNRCIRLNYEHQFHLDILPASNDPKNGGTCILIPDRELKCWTASNPKGFASWFDDRARQLTQRRLMEKAEPIPNQEKITNKAPLKLLVQLLKRERDTRYRNNSESAPASIVLTTLAAQLYRGEQSLFSGLGGILSGISESAQASYPRMVVLNPTNPEEDLSERWSTEPGAYRDFLEGINDFAAQWKTLSQVRGIEKVTRVLERLFGEELARHAIKEQTRVIEAARARNELGMKKASGIISGVAASSVIPIPRNTFYGEEE